MSAERLPVLRWLAHQDIDRKAGEVRALYISDPPGQAAVYLAKGAEAAAYLAAHAIDPETASAGPYLAAEATRRGMTALALATEVAAAAAAWDAASPQIEAERVGGKQDVNEAEDVAAVEAARTACLAALDSLQP